MAEKGIKVLDANEGEVVACRDAVEQDDTSTDRIIQLVDSAGRKSTIDGATPLRSLEIAVDSRGDSFDLADMPDDVESTALTIGDADSIVVAVQLQGNEDDSKIVVIPVVFDGINSAPLAILEPKSFNIIYDVENTQALSYTAPIIWSIDAGGTNHVNDSTIDMTGRDPKAPNISPDGTKFLWSEYGAGEFVVGTLSTPFLMSSYGSESSVNSGSYYENMAVNPDGTRLILQGSGTTFRDYTMDPWDVTSLTATGNTFACNGSNWAVGMCITPDGKHLYEQVGDTIQYYTMSTGWDVTTMAYVSATDISSTYPTASFKGCDINADGTKYIIIDSNNDLIVQLDFATPFDPSSYSDSGYEVDFSAHENNPDGMQMAADGSRVYFFGGDAKTVHSYDFTQATPDTYLCTPLQSWNTMGSTKIGFLIFHDSAVKKAVTVDLFASVISKESPGYNILEKSTSGQVGSFPSVIQYGTDVT